MVRGSPDGKEEADLVLDEIVRKTISFLNGNPTHVAKEQPEGNFIYTKFDRELTDMLVQAGLVSEGHVALLSGTKIDAPTEFENGTFQLVVYAPKNGSKWEQSGGINMSLYIRLRKGTIPAIINAICDYSVEGDRTVRFEEAQGMKVEGWVGEFRKLPSSAAVNQGYSYEDHPNYFLYGNAPEGRSLIGPDGKPIKEFLFPGSKVQLANDPPDTIYKPVEDNPNMIGVYFSPASHKRMMDRSHGTAQ